MNPNLIIRRLEKSDAQAVHALQRSLFPGDVNSLTIDEFAAVDGSGGVNVLVAELSEAITGFLVLRNRGVRPWTGIDFVGVSAIASGQGIGTKLLEAAVHISPRPFLRLFVRPSNSAARALYLRSGFHHTGTRKANYDDGEDAMVLMKWVGFRPLRARPKWLNNTIS